jgi:hypothetical protein
MASRSFPFEGVSRDDAMITQLVASLSRELRDDSYPLITGPVDAARPCE